MSVHKTKYGTYEVRYREGNRNRGKGGFKTEREAEGWDITQKAAKLKGQHVIRAKDTPYLEDLARRFQQRRAKDGIAKSTRLFNASVLDKHIAPYLGHLRVAEITPAVLDEWRSRSQATPYMLNRAQELLGQLLAYGMDLGYIEANPAARLKRLAHKTRRGKTASPEQVEAMRDYMLGKERTGYATLLSVLAYVGLRPAEALGLRWGALRNRQLFIDCHASNGEIADGTKTRKDRYPEAPAPALADLARWRLEQSSPEGLIFPRGDGMPWRKTDWDNWRSRWFRPAAKAAGLEKFRPYDLRHSCASLLLRSQTPPAEVAAHMGHSLQVLFDTYGHEIEDLRGKPPEPIERAILRARHGDGVRSMFGREAS